MMHTSITLEEDLIKNKSLFNKFTLDTLKVKVVNVSDVEFEFNKDFNSKLHARIAVEIRVGAVNELD